MPIHFHSHFILLGGGGGDRERGDREWGGRGRVLEALVAELQKSEKIFSDSKQSPF
jgi:hypothetical protein